LSDKIKSYFKDNGINLRLILIYLLLISSFLPKTYLPYIVITILAVFSFIYFRKTLSGKVFVYFLIALFAISVISWLYNFFVYHDIDFLGLIIWWLTNLFPFLIIILIATLDEDIDIRKVINFYFLILLFEFFIIIFQATEKNKFYGDHITGTCYDAHVLSIHFSIGIILALSEIFLEVKRNSNIIVTNRSNKNVIKNLLYILIFFTGQLMAAYKANIIILYTVLLLFFFYHFIKEISIFKKQLRKTLKYTVAFVALVIVIFIALTQTYLLEDLQTHTEMTINNVDNISKQYDIEDWQDLERWGGKVYSYQVAFSKIPKEINWFFGYGPSTYISRASIYRNSKMSYYITKISEDKLKLSKEKVQILKKFFSERISKIDYKYIYKIRFNSTLNAPMTSVINIWVELGLQGFLFFIIFFSYLFIKLRKVKVSNPLNGGSEYFNLNNFLILLLAFFILELFYFNYWEYPEFVTPVMVFCILAINNRKRLQNI